MRAFEGLLLSTHTLLSVALKTPEIQLSQPEAEALAQAIATVSEHYDVSGVVPPETLAWLNLAQCVGFIYGPRVFAARNRKAMERAQAAQQQETGTHGPYPTGAEGYAAH